MRRRSSAGGEPAKVQRRKTVARKSRVTSKAAADPKSSSAAREETKTRLARERNEALQQQIATADVLKIISRSTFDLQAVFATLVESAARLCRADKATVTWLKEHQLPVVAAYGFSDEFTEYIRTRAPRLDRSSVAGRCLLEGRPVQVPDVMNDPEFQFQEAATIGGFRTALGVPLMRQNTPIGVLFLARDGIEPFTQQQIDLITTFADQAVIAIENTRLFEAEQQRTRELAESLEQQTATSEVLQVISSSPGDLEPVFAAMLAKAVRICDAKFGILYLREGSGFRLAAAHDVPPAYAKARGAGAIPPVPGGILESIMKTGRTMQLPDVAALQSFAEGHPISVAAVEVAGMRSSFGVPMLRENQLIGVITIYRQEVRPFTDKQIELVANFAAQAVIAIENTRLLHELRESLQQQTATADVLKVISRSTFDLQTVLDTLVESAAQLCAADKGAINMWDGQGYRLRANYGYAREAVQFVLTKPAQVDRGSLTGRVALEGKAIHICDVLADPEYRATGVQQAIGFRTALGVPLLRQGTTIGVFFLSRDEVNPFTEKQIELVTTFADQAVIAIENARLFEAEQQRTRELSEALEQQTATSEVLQVISSSPGELEPVFGTMLENAIKLCQAKFGAMYLYDGEAFRTAALHGVSPAFAEARREALVVRHLHPDYPIARIARTNELIHIADLRLEQSYIERDPRMVEAVDLAGARSLVMVPMLKEGRLIGAISVYRQEVRPFTDKQIKLVTNFAAQAVIAIENTRLLNELRQRTTDLTERTDDLTEALEQQTATADVLKVISRSTFDLQAVLDTLVQSAARLCDSTTPSFSGAKAKTTSGEHTTVSRANTLNT